MAAPLFELSGIHKSYGTGTEVEVEVLHGIDLSLATGEFAALIDHPDRASRPCST